MAFFPVIIPYLKNINFFFPLPYFLIFKSNVMHLWFKMVSSSEEVKQKAVQHTGWEARKTL